MEKSFLPGKRRETALEALRAGGENLVRAGPLRQMGRGNP